MMYCEFVAGTGCADNAHNYGVFKNLEVMYMNSDMTKAEIYEYGKKLVDNSKSAETVKLENELKAQIAESKARIADCKRFLDYYKCMNDRNMVRYYQSEIKAERRRIAECKWVLEG